MAGSKVGAVKRMTGFGRKGYKCGSMVMKMNSMRYSRGPMRVSPKNSPLGNAVKGIKGTLTGAGQELDYLGGQVAKGAKFAGSLGKAFARNIIGGDIKGIVKKTIPGKMACKTKGIKKTGKSFGKSNKLGYGGRAAQLKAQGVPGYVIGKLARAAQAGPGQKNYHG